MDWTPIIVGNAKTRIFGREELQRLHRLRRRYQMQPEIFAERELGRLRFVRWLVSTGRLQA